MCLPGFDDQISKNKALADEAIKKLPSINATIQQAVGNNSETLFIIGSVSGDYDDALGTVNNLEAVVSQLEVNLTDFFQWKCPTGLHIYANPQFLHLHSKRVSDIQNNEANVLSHLCI